MVVPIKLLVPELEGNLGSLKLSSEGELRKAKNRGKKLKRRAMLQAAKAAVVAGNSTEEARKLILSKTLQNQKNKMKRKAKKTNSVSKPNMAESAKTTHQVSLILKKRQRSDDQATPETGRKKPREVTPKSADYGTPNATGVKLKSSGSNLTLVASKVTLESADHGESSRGTLEVTVEPSSSKVNTKSFKDVLVEDLTVGLVNVDGSSMDPCTAEALQDKLDDLINITVTQGLPAPVFASAKLVNGNYKVTCNNATTLAWLRKAVVDILKIWPEGKFKVVGKDELQKTVRIALHIPNLKHLEVKIMLAKIEAQNPNLKAKSWRFNARKDYREGGGEMIFLSIDESEAEKIRKNGNRLHFGMSHIKCVIRGGKKVQQA